MAFKARALYDFEGEPHSTELSISVGDILKITRTDVGEGWYEGLNERGQSGLFPVDYVERISESVSVTSAPQPPALPPPNNQPADPWGGTAENDDGYDPNWDDDDSYEVPSSGGPPPNQENVYANADASNAGSQSGYAASNVGDSHHGTVSRKTTLISFNAFTKMGGDDFIQGIVKGGTKEVTIMCDTEGNSLWMENLNPYTVTVKSPKKESKLKGLKTFIAYQLTPSFAGVQVSRRYKHFDWLHERLTEKFGVIAIPPLPDKQISGRYEDIFIERRRTQLQEFVDYVCRHPVLSKSWVFDHFLRCTDEKQWKSGKRTAEKDVLIGAHFCECIETPDKDLLPQQIEERVTTSFKFIQSLDSSLKAVSSVGVEQIKKNQNNLKPDFVKLGQTLFGLGTAIESSNKIAPSHLATVSKRIGAAYLDIGKLYEEQHKFDWEPLLDKLHLYRGLTSSFNVVFAFQKGAQQKKKECEKTMNGVQLNSVSKRTDIVNYALLAELEHFKKERDTDFKAALKTYLKEQVNFYKKIVGKLEDTLREFDD